MIYHFIKYFDLSFYKIFKSYKIFRIIIFIKYFDFSFELTELTRSIKYFDFSFELTELTRSIKYFDLSFELTELTRSIKYLKVIKYFDFSFYKKFHFKLKKIKNNQFFITI